ncbi:hypothetical protein Taro_021298 [Colocasia esculenta]|uniref:Knottins-like domain-containing protein n=1 Tax=Colocasia esculenta TaxID=4460 RepID=A0A843VB22_COLES|nr:hypothetical protein [Colocasia esculenta]
MLDAWSAGEMVGTTRVADARTCSTRSLTFRGICLIDANCANVCRAEGFNSGDCRGFRLRCFCTIPCA